MQRLAAIEVDQSSQIKTSKLKSVYKSQVKRYQEHGNALEIFYELANEHLLYSSAHRNSPVRHIMKALCDLGEGKYSTKAHLEKLQERTFKHFVLIQDIKSHAEKVDEEVNRQRYQGREIEGFEQKTSFLMN